MNSLRNTLKKTTNILAVFSLLILIGCTANSQKKVNTETATKPTINTLTETEKEQGWILLFDGKTFDGWRGLGSPTVPEGHWLIENGVIHKVENGKVPVKADGQPLEGGDLMSIDTFQNFDLTFEWKISEGGNSGIKYNVSEEISARGGSHSALGFEYQVLDDKGYPEKLKPSQYSASLYDLIAAKNIQLKPVGEFNTGRILLDGNHGEHWLNGVKVVEYELGTALFDSLYQKSKFVKHPDFPEKRAGHIVIQNHSDDAWYRNIKIRRLVK